MGEKNGGMFNMIVVVVIAAIIITAMTIFVPEAMTAITTGAKNLISEGFGRGPVTPVVPGT